VLTHSPFARIPSPIPRCPRPVRSMLASRSDDGLRLFRTGSAATLPFSRLAQCSCSLGSACSLIPPKRDLFARRLRPGPSPARVAPVASGWSISCRVGYPPPTGWARPFHGARETRANGRQSGGAKGSRFAWLRSPRSITTHGHWKARHLTENQPVLTSGRAATPWPPEGRRATCV
jgi:hypothetical protein